MSFFNIFKNLRTDKMPASPDGVKVECLGLMVGAGSIFLQDAFADLDKSAKDKDAVVYDVQLTTGDKVFAYGTAYKK